MTYHIRRIHRIRVRILRIRRMHQHQQQLQQQPQHWHRPRAWHQPLVQHLRTSCQFPKRSDRRMTFHLWGEWRLLCHLPMLVQHQPTSCRGPRRCVQHMRNLHRGVLQCQLHILTMAQLQLIFCQFCIRSMWKRSLEHRLMARHIDHRKGHSRLRWLLR